MAGDFSLIVELFKHKWVKFSVITIFLCLAAFSIFVFTKAILGYHVNILGIEVNIPEPKIDTVHTIKEIHDTTKIIAPETMVKLTPKIEKKQALKKEKSDTVISTPVTVTGDKNHIVSGTGNLVGINGDVNFEKELNERDKIDLINFIEKIKRDSSVNTNCATVSVTTNSNGTKFSSQLTKFLQQNGYVIKGGGLVFTQAGMPLEGVLVEYKAGCISIVVGILD